MNYKKMNKIMNKNNVLLRRNSSPKATVLRLDMKEATFGKFRYLTLFAILIHRFAIFIDIHNVLNYKWPLV